MTDRARLNRALVDPADVFDRPAAVLADRTLGPAEKVDVLRRWAYDAQEVEQAESEGMPGRDDDLMPEILSALRALGADPDGPHGAPRRPAKGRGEPR